MEKDNIMKFETVLPVGFDGTFRFTNWSDEEFVGKWGGKEYHFPPQSTSPILINDQTPLEIQQIRKKFAKNLAEREFAKSQEFGKLMSQERNNDGSPRLNSIHQAGTYSVEALTSYIQKCLVPLQVVKAEVTDAPKIPMEDKLTKGDDGQPNTVAIDKKTSLREKALNQK